jgi:tRNA 2-thiocytidine biosynthesis protein TtcA
MKSVNLLYSTKRQKSCLYFISRKAGKAICDYNMIQDGDRVLVGVSGGKDSLTLLNILEDRKRIAPVSFEIKAVHLDLDFISASEILIKYFQIHGFDYHVERVNITDYTQNVNCFICSRIRKKVLFEIAERFGYNKIALAHHKDDIVETFFLNMIFQSNLSTMTPNQSFFNGRFRIIRPLAYVGEAEIKRFAKMFKLPVLEANCPYEGKERRFIKDVLKLLEKEHRGSKSNIFNSLKRVKLDYLL